MDHITGGTQFLSGGADNNLILWGFTGPGDSSKGLGAPSQLLVVPLASPPVGIAIGSAFSKVTVATALTGILEVDVSEEADDVPPTLLLSAHRQRVAAVAAHPTVPVFVTCSQDATLRLWSMKERRVMTSAAIVAAGSAVCFSGDGSLVACGTVDGSIQVFGARSGYPPCLDLRFEDNVAGEWGAGTVAGGYPAPNPRTRQMRQRQMRQRQPRRRRWQETQSSRRARAAAGRSRLGITAIRFSPSGDFLAAGCEDSRIYLLRRATSRRFPGPIIVRGSALDTLPE